MWSPTSGGPHYKSMKISKEELAILLWERPVLTTEFIKTLDEIRSSMNYTATSDCEDDIEVIIKSKKKRKIVKLSKIK